MRRLFLALILASVSFRALAAPQLTDVIKRYSNLRLGEARQVSNINFTVGHARLAIPGGTAAPVMAGDEQVGVYFLASGTFTYESVDKDEFPVVRYNARNGGVNLESSPDKLTIHEPFKDLFLCGNPLPELNGVTVAAPSADYERHRESFDRQWTTPIEHLLAIRALDAPSAQVLRAQIGGTRHQLVYLFDDVYAHTETLQRLHKIPFPTSQMKRVLLTTNLSRQAIGRSGRETAPARFVLSNVDIALTATEKDDASMTIVETIIPRRPVNVLRFDLYSEYYFSPDRPPRRFNVRSVQDEKGNAVPYVHSSGELLVGLPATAEVGKPLELRFEIYGNFLYRPGGDSYWELGIEPWFPQPELNEQAYTYHGVIKVKKPFVPISPGKTIRREVEGDYNVVETKIDQPVAFVAILAGRYHLDEHEKNGTIVRVATYAMRNAQASKLLANIAFAAIEYYPMFLGPFPFTEINVVQKNDFGYGQAPPATVYITNEAFTPKLGDANEYVEGVNLRFAHEIAHQYWGTVVKMPSAEEQWLTEAFAEYSAALFMKAAGRKGDYDRALIHWKADAKDASPKASIPTANRLSNPGDPLGQALARQGLIYAKGAYLLAVLHQELGDNPFLTFLKSYQRSFRWQFGTTEDAIGLLKFVTKKDYAPFFDEYFYGTAMPEIKR